MVDHVMHLSLLMMGGGRHRHWDVAARMWEQPAQVKSELWHWTAVHPSLQTPFRPFPPPTTSSSSDNPFLLSTNETSPRPPARMPPPFPPSPNTENKNAPNVSEMFPKKNTPPTILDQFSKIRNPLEYYACEESHVKPTFTIPKQSYM